MDKLEDALKNINGIKKIKLAGLIKLLLDDIEDAMDRHSLTEINQVINQYREVKFSTLKKNMARIRKKASGNMSTPKIVIDETIGENDDAQTEQLSGIDALKQQLLK